MMACPRRRKPDATPIPRVVVLAVTLFMAASCFADSGGGLRHEVPDGKLLIERPRPDSKGGQAYRLIYTVDVPVEVYWRFKTDFDNTFVTTHRYITSHRMVQRTGKVVITENTYRNHGDMVFRWQTTIDNHARRLEYVLLNPRSVEHRFHRGTIEVMPIEGQTLVVQTAYFNFFGAFLWANLPVPGGMRSSLKYTARWERETVRRLRDQYATKICGPP